MSMSQIREEVYFTKGRIIVRGKLVTRGKAKRADYILYYKPNIPIALIEAKDNNHTVGAGMQQASSTRQTLDIPFVFSSNGDGFLFHDRTGQGAKSETELSLDAFPTPDELWAQVSRLERPGAGARRRSSSRTTHDDGERQGAALLPAHRDQQDHRSHRQGPGSHPARHGHRHRQDLHRVSNHLAFVEGQAQETHSLPR